jgi:hypothetical protein
MFNLEEYKIYYNLPLYSLILSSYLSQNINLSLAVELLSSSDKYNLFTEISKKLKSGIPWEHIMDSYINKYKNEKIKQFFIVLKNIYYLTPLEGSRILHNFAIELLTKIQIETKESIKKVSAYTYVYTAFVTLAPTLCIIISSMGSLIGEFVSLPWYLPYVLLLFASVIYLFVLFLSCPFILVNLVSIFWE